MFFLIISKSVHGVHRESTYSVHRLTSLHGVYIESMYSLCIVFSGSPSGVPVYIDSTGSPLGVEWESM